MTKQNNEDFKNSTKCQIFGNDYVDNDDKVRDHCHVTRKYRGSAHRDCNISLKLDPVEFHHLKYYGFHLIVQPIRQTQSKNKCYTKWIRKIYELYYQ